MFLLQWLPTFPPSVLIMGVKTVTVRGPGVNRKSSPVPHRIKMGDACHRELLPAPCVACLLQGYGQLTSDHSHKVSALNLRVWPKQLECKRSFLQVLFLGFLSTSRTMSRHKTPLNCLQPSHTMRILFYVIKYNTKCRYHCTSSNTVDCT